MREFEFPFSEGLQKGLRPYNVGRNVQFFEILRGARVGKAGLEPIEQLTSAYSHTPPITYPALNIDWPFPQYFSGMDLKAIGLRRTFFEILNDGSLLPVVIDIDDIQTDDLWSVGDFGLYWLVAKGRDLVLERAGDTGLWTLTDIHATIPLAKTVCNFKGQAVVGNISFTTWVEADESYIGWSDIGNVDFTLDRRGVAGYKHAEFRGGVHEVKQLGNGVVVYGENGIGFLKATTAPITTFGYNKIAAFGIMNEGAIAGNEFIHVFVSNEGDLYRVTYEGGMPKLEVLGFRHLLDSDSDVIVSFLPGSNSEATGDFYISDGSYSYLLTSYGLSQANQIPTSVVRVDGVAKGFFTEGDSDFVAVTNVLDFGFRARKTIQAIEVGCSGSGTYSVALDYRNTPSEAFNTTQYVELNNQGIVTLVCGGIEFRLRLAYDTPSDIDISYINIRYKADDLRGIRGVYAKG